MVISIIAATLAGLSAILALWQLTVAWRFPLHRRHHWRPTSGTAPGLTVLKPIKGCDSATESCLRSWFQQDYTGPRQLLIGVASLDDPVVPLARRLIDQHPDWNGQLVSCDQAMGVNAKVSTLIQLHARASHGFLCVSDADVWAPPDFLTQAMGLLEEPGIGLVNSFYEIKDVAGFGLRWEAVAINADFWSQVLQSASLRPLDFALGAAMVFRRDPFDQSGGFRPFADLLADDFHLGNRLSRQGLAIQLSPIVVECRSDPVGFPSVWLHQLRWARTIRTCRGLPYFLSILSNATVWPALWWATSAGSSTAIAAMGLLAMRAIQALLLERRLTRRWDLTSLWMAWVKDALQLAIWALAFAGTTVSWREVRYRVDASGRLTRLGATTTAAGPQAAPAARELDAAKMAKKKKPSPKKFAGAA